jgi:hypothetical protein
MKFDQAQPVRLDSYSMSYNMKMTVLVLVVSMLHLSASEMQLQLDALDSRIPVRIDDSVATNGRMILSIYNRTNRSCALELFRGVVFAMYNSAGKTIPMEAVGSGSLSKGDVPTLEPWGIHCRPFYLWETLVDGRRFLKISDRVGLMWTFGPIDESSVWINASYSMEQRGGDAALERGFINQLADLYTGEIKSNKIKITLQSKNSDDGSGKK